MADTPFQRTIGQSLERRGKHVYGGTVSEKTALRRLAQAKAAKRARRQNRAR